MVTVGKFCFHFSGILGSVVDYINFSPSAHGVDHALRDVQNVCTVTIVGTVLKLVNSRVG